MENGDVIIMKKVTKSILKGLTGSVLFLVGIGIWIRQYELLIHILGGAMTLCGLCWIADSRIELKE